MDKFRYSRTFVILIMAVFIFIFMHLKFKVIYQNEVSHKIKASACKEDIIYNLQETSTQRCLIYNMVPKCGSTGIRTTYEKLGKVLNYTAFEGNYQYKYVNSAFRHSHSIMKTVLQNAECDQPDRHIYYRHQPFADFQIIGQKTPFHTNIIRDPVEHYISWYYFRRYPKTKVVLGPLKYFNSSFYNSVQWAKLRNMTFDECVQSNHEECKSYKYIFNIIPYFCGTDSHCVVPSEQSLAQAQKNIIKYFPVVGYLENLIQYLELCEVFWPQFFTGAVDMVTNASKPNSNAKRKQFEPSELTKLIMRKRLGLEYRFYDWVKQRFECIYDHYK